MAKPKTVFHEYRWLTVIWSDSKKKLDKIRLKYIDGFDKLAMYPTKGKYAKWNKYALVLHLTIEQRAKMVEEFKLQPKWPKKENDSLYGIHNYVI